MQELEKAEDFSWIKTTELKFTFVTRETRCKRDDRIEIRIEQQTSTRCSYKRLSSTTIYHKMTISIQGEFTNSSHAQVLATDYKIPNASHIREKQTLLLLLTLLLTLRDAECVCEVRIMHRNIAQSKIPENYACVSSALVALLEIRWRKFRWTVRYCVRPGVDIHEFRRIISRSRETKTDNADTHVCVRCVWVSSVSFSGA